MNYLLTQQEYDGLTKAVERAAKLPDAEQLQILCTKIATEMPVTVSWMRDQPPQPWGCILTKGDTEYCDECPVKKICQNPFKDWSK